MNIAADRVSKENKRKGKNRWGVILAGGDGLRLRSLTKLITGDDRPKQFCRILGNESLLERTIRRAELGIERGNILISLTRTHEEFYKFLLDDTNAERLVIQPANLGTAPAILYSLLRISTADPHSTVAFFPSDHYISNDEAFTSQIVSAFGRAQEEPDKIVLLGIKPEYPETEYGWIEPITRSTDCSPMLFSRVKRFWEKPPKALALELAAKGCLWNSFVMVGRVSTFLQVIKRSIPGLYKCFASVRNKIGTQYESDSIDYIYENLTPTNFSHRVLEASTKNLLVLTLADVGWSDLGEPRRVLSVLENFGINIDWKAGEDDFVHQTG